MFTYVYTNINENEKEIHYKLGLRLLSEIRSGSDPKIRISGEAESGSGSKMLDPSKPNPDPYILIF